MSALLRGYIRSNGRGERFLAWKRVVRLETYFRVDSARALASYKRINDRVVKKCLLTININNSRAAANGKGDGAGI